MSRYTTPAIQKAVRGLFSGGRKKVRGLVIPDWHIPQHDRLASELMFQHAKEENYGYDFWIQLGDLMNFHAISTHNKLDRLTVEGARLQKDFDSANLVLDKLQEAIPGPGFVLKGNHDFRLDRYLAEHPELVDLGFTIPEKLRFEDRGITWVDNWAAGHVLQIGNATFVHGSVTNKHHAAAMLGKFQTNVFYGHTHDIQQHSLVTAAEDKVRVGQSLGCLIDRDAFWMKYNGNNWQLAFADFTFYRDGGFSYTVHQIHDYRSEIGGRTFTPKGIAA